MSLVINHATSHDVVETTGETTTGETTTKIVANNGRKQHPSPQEPTSFALDQQAGTEKKAAFPAWIDMLDDLWQE